MNSNKVFVGKPFSRRRLLVIALALLLIIGMGVWYFLQVRSSAEAVANVVAKAREVLSRIDPQSSIEEREQELDGDQELSRMLAKLTEDQRKQVGTALADTGIKSIGGTPVVASENDSLAENAEPEESNKKQMWQTKGFAIRLGGFGAQSGDTAPAADRDRERMNELDQSNPSQRALGAMISKAFQSGQIRMTDSSGQVLNGGVIKPAGNVQIQIGVSKP